MDKTFSQHFMPQLSSYHWIHCGRFKSSDNCSPQSSLGTANRDEESGPPAPNAQRGDNMTVLDEYRGLFVNGTWTDTDPEGWDVFVRSESGLGYATNLPGMTLHLMGLNEVAHSDGKVLDYQASNANGMNGSNVYAIRLKNDNVPYNRQNPQTSLGHMGLGPPSSSTKGLIYPNVIEGRLGDGQTKNGGSCVK